MITWLKKTWSINQQLSLFIMIHHCSALFITIHNCVYIYIIWSSLHITHHFIITIHHYSSLNIIWPPFHHHHTSVTPHLPPSFTDSARGRSFFRLAPSGPPGSSAPSPSPAPTSLRPRPQRWRYRRRGGSPVGEDSTGRTPTRRFVDGKWMIFI